MALLDVSDRKLLRFALYSRVIVLLMQVTASHILRVMIPGPVSNSGPPNFRSIHLWLGLDLVLDCLRLSLVSRVRFNFSLGSGLGRVMIRA